MKHECDIIRDLMPLCIDETASVKSRDAVDEHVAECKPCEQVYAEMKSAVSIPAPQPKENPEFARAVRRMKNRRHRRVWLTLLLGVMIAAAVALAGLWGYYWYFVEMVEVTPGRFTFHNSPDGIAMLNVGDIPQGAELQIRVCQEDLNGDGVPNCQMYVSVSATRAELRGTELKSYYYIFGTERDGAFYMSNDGSVPVEIEQIIHGTPAKGGTIVFVKGGSIQQVPMYGLTIRSPQIFWSWDTSSMRYFEAGSYDGVRLPASPTPQPIMNSPTLVPMVTSTPEP